MIAAMNHAAPDNSGVVFVSDLPDQIGTRINGVDVLSYAQLLENRKSMTVAVAIAETQARRDIVAKCQRDELQFTNIIASSHRRYDDVAVGEGAIICDNTIFTSNARIGRHFHCNIYSYVAHDCVIGDFVTFAPRVSCNGRIVIEDDVYVGTGAVLRHGTPGGQPLRIGKGAIIGMGAVVTRDVPPGVTVIGNPARIKEA